MHAPGIKAGHCRDPQVEAVLFDMDNTLFDFVHAQLRACKAVILHLGLPHPADALFSYFRRPVHGFEHHNNILDFLSDNGVFTARAFAECCAIYDSQKVGAIIPYPGIEPVLEVLCGYGLPLAVVTDAPNGNAVKRLDKAGLLSYFTEVISPEQSGAAKPNPASFRLAISRLNVAVENTVVVGDSIRRDIEPAQQLGMTAIYAKYGDRYFPERNSPCVPDYVADDVYKIQKIMDCLPAVQKRTGLRSAGFNSGPETGYDIPRVF